MKLKLATTCFVIGTALVPVAYAADSDTDRANPGAYVQDSVITAKIKAKLAAEHLNSAVNIKVDTYKEGVVFMSGTANSQAEADKAVAIARETEGVKTVNNELKVKQ